MNQCDGCAQGAPINANGNHTDKDGHPFMSCQKERYVERVRGYRCVCGAPDYREAHFCWA